MFVSCGLNRFCQGFTFEGISKTINQVKSLDKIFVNKENLPFHAIRTHKRLFVTILNLFHDGAHDATTTRKIKQLNF